MKFIRNLLIFAFIGGIVFINMFQIEGLEQLQVRRRADGTSMLSDVKAMLASRQTSGSASSLQFDGLPQSESAAQSLQSFAGAGLDAKTVRLGTFNLNEFSRDKVSDESTMEIIGKLLQQFDVVALQELDPARNDLLPKVVRHLNRGGRQFDFIAGPKVGPVGHEQRLAFIFDQASVEADRKQTYTVSDPGNRIAYEPLVAWFRTRGVPPTAAWTFSMANVYIDPDNPGTETTLLSTIFQSIHDDGRGEDDVVLAGCLFAADDQLATLLPRDTAFALESTASDVLARRQTSNVIFSRSSTTEFSGNSGTIDFLRQFNLTIAGAEAISGHLPVWADFQITEDQRLFY